MLSVKAQFLLNLTCSTVVDTAFEKRLKFLAILKQSEDWFMSEVRLS